MLADCFCCRCLSMLLMLILWVPVLSAVSLLGCSLICLVFWPALICSGFLTLATSHALSGGQRKFGSVLLLLLVPLYPVMLMPLLVAASIMGSTAVVALDAGGRGSKITVWHPGLDSPLGVYSLLHPVKLPRLRFSSICDRLMDVVFFLRYLTGLHFSFLTFLGDIRVTVGPATPGGCGAAGAAFLGVILAGLPCLVLFILKAPLLVLAMFFRYTGAVTRYLCEGPAERLLLSTVCLLPLVLSPLLLVPLLVGSACGLVALSAAWPSHSTTSIGTGIIGLYQVFWYTDVLTNSLIISSLSTATAALQSCESRLMEGQRPQLKLEMLSCLPYVPMGACEHASWHKDIEIELTFGNFEWSGISEAKLRSCWCSFFLQCFELSCELIRSGRLSMEPFAQSHVPAAMLGVAAVVLCRTLAKSPNAASLNLAALLKNEDRELLVSSAPPGGPELDLIWAAVMRANAALHSAALELPTESEALETLLLLRGIAEEDMTDSAQRRINESQSCVAADRRSVLTNVAASVHRAIMEAASRNAEFQRCLQVVLNEIV